MHALPLWLTALVSVVGLVLCLYVIFCPRVNYAIYRPLLFHPWKSAAGDPVAPPVAGVVGENIFFPSENGKLLNGWYYKEPKAKYTVIFHHGNGGNVSVRCDLVELLLQSHLSVFIYDYEGYGESAGLPTVEGICQDGAGAYKYLVEVRHVDADTIIFYGESLGAAVATYLSTKYQCKALILQSGFTSLRNIACEVFPLLTIYPPLLFSSPNLDTLAVLRNPHPPILLIHGDQDEVVPVHHAQILYEQAVEPKKLLRLPTTGHADIYSTAAPVYQKAIQSFIQALP